MASSSNANEVGSASSLQTIYQRALRLWNELADNLLADERYLEIFNCGLCYHVMEEVTVVTICRHKFCRFCIDEYVNEDGVRSCPTCSVSLGDNPEQYLWHDGLFTHLINSVTEYHRLRRLLPETVPPPPPQPNTVPPPPPPPQPNTVPPPPPQPNTVPPPPPQPNTVPPPPPQSNTAPPPAEPSVQVSGVENHEGPNH